jgi:hypothetical protein
MKFWRAGLLSTVPAKQMGSADTKSAEERGAIASCDAGEAGKLASSAGKLASSAMLASSLQKSPHEESQRPDGTAYAFAASSRVDYARTNARWCAALW